MGISFGFGLGPVRMSVPVRAPRVRLPRASRQLPPAETAAPGAAALGKAIIGMVAAGLAMFPLVWLIVNWRVLVVLAAVAAIGVIVVLICRRRRDSGRMPVRGSSLTSAERDALAVELAEIERERDA